MEPSIENFDLQEEIIRYLNGEMEAVEKSDFENRIQKDVALAQELQNYRNIMNGIEHWGDMQLKNLISKVDIELENQNFFKQHVPISKPGIIQFIKTNKIYAIAATVFLTVTSLFLIKFFNSNSNIQDQWFAEYYHADESTTKLVISQLDPSGFIPSSLPADSIQWALQNYLDGNYRLSLEFFSRCSLEEGIGNLCSYYQALNYLALSETEKAIPLLRPLCDIKNQQLQSASCWYLALALMKTSNETSEWKSLLKRVSEDKESTFSQQAQVLVDKMK